jgi:hypothetical protein
MKTFAVIENEVVVNVIFGIEPEVVAANPTLYVEYTDSNPAGIGWTYDGKKFIAPVMDEKNA